MLTASPTLRFFRHFILKAHLRVERTFESADVLSPLLMVIVAIYPLDSETLCMALALVLTDLGKMFGL